MATAVELWLALVLVIFAIFFSVPIVKLLLWALVKLTRHYWIWPKEFAAEVESPMIWMLRIGFLWAAIAAVHLNLGPLPIWIFGVPLLSFTNRTFNVIANVVVRRGMKNHTEGDQGRRSRLVDATKGIRNLLLFLIGYAIYPGNLPIVPPNTIVLPLVAVFVLLSLASTPLSNNLMAAILYIGLDVERRSRLAFQDLASGTMLFLSRGNFKLRRADGTIDFLPAGQLLFSPLRVYSSIYRNSLVIHLSPRTTAKEIRLVLRDLSIMLQEIILPRLKKHDDNSGASRLIFHTLSMANVDHHASAKQVESDSVKTLGQDLGVEERVSESSVDAHHFDSLFGEQREDHLAMSSSYVYYCGGHDIRMVWASSHVDDVLHLQEASQVVEGVHNVLDAAKVRLRASILVRRERVEESYLDSLPHEPG